MHTVGLFFKSFVVLFGGQITLQGHEALVKKKRKELNRLVYGACTTVFRVGILSILFDWNGDEK